MNPHEPAPGQRSIPRDEALRTALHREIHARPPARMGLPVQMLSIAVRNTNISVEQECAHLAKLPGQRDLKPELLQDHLLRMQAGPCTVKWERHTEFTRYSVLRALPPSTLLSDNPQQLLPQLFLDAGWLADIPGETIAAIHLVMLHGDPATAITRTASYDHWFAEGSAVASLLGQNTHSCAVTDFALQPDGFERILVIAAPGMTEPRAGRVAQRLLDIELYRLMALRGLATAQQLRKQLSGIEQSLTSLTEQLQSPGKGQHHPALLNMLLPLVAELERATLQHTPHWGASRAYHALVNQRIAELREKAIPGTSTIGASIQKRLAPAMATVESTAQRLDTLCQSAARINALLQTRVAITSEAHHQQQLTQLQDELARGQALQRGLAVALISACAMGLLLLAGRAIQSAGVALNLEGIAGALLPVVIVGVWWGVRRIFKSTP